MAKRRFLVTMAFGTLMILLVGPVAAEWSEPVLHEELNDAITGEHAEEPSLTRDGLTIYFRRNNASGLRQLVVATRNTHHGPFTTERVLSELNEGSNIYDCWISDDELRVYYSRYETGTGERIIRMAERSSKSEPWTPTLAFTDIHEYDNTTDTGPSLSPDELTMYYWSSREQTETNYIVCVATRASINDQFSNPTEIPELNIFGQWTMNPYVLPDGLTMYFDTREDNESSWSIFKATRSSLSNPFGNIEKVGVSTDAFHEVDADLSPDEKTILFHRYLGAGTFESYWIEPEPFYYVDAVGGNDGNDGLSVETAFATIGRGVEVAVDGDTVLVYPGVYAEAVNFDGKAITIRSAEDAAIIDGDDASAAATGQGGDSGLPGVDPMDATLSGVSFANGEGSESVLENIVIRRCNIGIFCVGPVTPTIRNVTVVDNNYGVMCAAAANPDISSSIFVNNVEDLYDCSAAYSWANGQATALSESLVGYWTFDETTGTVLRDSAGGNDGTVHGAQWTTGQAGNALLFDGMNDYVELANNAVTTTEFTLMAWANQYGEAGGYYNQSTFFTQRDDRINGEYSAISLSTKNAIYQCARAAIRGSGDGGQSLHYETQPYNTWHHYAITVSPTEFVFYVDGIETNGTTNEQTGSFTTNIDHVLIGADKYSNKDTGFFNGAIDELAVYDRALSAVEVQQLYENGLEGLSYNSPADPLFADPCNGDYHLQSRIGRYDAATSEWVLDDLTSPCVDGGDPTVNPMAEPMPNGARVNMGAYGGTEYASKSPNPWPSDADLNRDGRVDLLDFAQFAQDWFWRAPWSD